MKYRKWSSQDKLMIVLEGLNAKVPLGELCVKYQINRSLYYKWRDMLLANGPKAFDKGTADRTTERLRTENHKLKRIIGINLSGWFASQAAKIIGFYCNREVLPV